jgi:probable F420-dependent oxidoreductase
MEFWQAIAHTESEQILDVARLAEELGFGAVTVGDHFVTPARIDSPYPYTKDRVPWVDPEDSTPDPMVLAAAIAQVTRSLRFFVTCYVLPMREPLSAAKAVSSAAVLTGNRLILGVGVGWMREEFALVGQAFATRGRRCDEMLEILAKLLGGGMVEHHGEFYDFPPIQMSPVPERPVPILIAGHSDAAFRRAARFDGWSAAHYDADEVPALVKRFRSIWKASGRSASDPSRDRPLVTVPLNHEPSLDDCKRLEDAGVTSIINMPLTFHGEATSTLERKRAALERFAERVIVPRR